jgi:hypothetical protein
LETGEASSHGVPRVFLDLFVSHPSNLNPRNGCLSGKLQNSQDLIRKNHLKTDWNTPTIWWQNPWTPPRFDVKAPDVSSKFPSEFTI